jgi:7-keto-8-aminopelargonate synthetase-like enzyme
MDGDLAPLPDLAALKERHGAWLMLDEAHATGLFGESRRGLAEAFAVSGQVDIHMGTLGKALGSAGGYICGSRVLIDFLINRARSLIFSTAPTPPAAAAAHEAVRIVMSPEGESRRKRLWNNVDRMKNALTRGGWPLPPVQSAIIPLMVGPEADALRWAAAWREAGVFLPAIRYPTVARGAARLRLTLTAAHEEAQCEMVESTLRQPNLAPLIPRVHPAPSAPTPSSIPPHAET